MRSLRHYLALGGLAVGMTALAACGADPTATSLPAASAAASARPSTAPSAGASIAPSAAPSAAPGSATRTTTAATTTTTGTATRAASPTTSAVGTATRAGSPVVGTATRTGSATPGAATPAQAYTVLRAQPSSRQAWIFSGFSVAGLTGDLRPVFEYNGGNQKVALAAGGVNLEAYQVGGATFVSNPLGGFLPADANNPLSAPAQTLFATPTAIVNTLAPANGTYTASGVETINGRQATRYTSNVTLADLSFVNPALAGQRGTAATILWVDNAQGYLVAMESTIRADQATGTTATARLDVTNVGQVPAIAVPR